MKKICTLFILLFSSCIVVGQSIHILYNNKDVTNGAVTVPVVKGQKAVVSFSLLNTTSNKLDYQVNRTILNPPVGECSSVFYCTSLQCFLPDTATTWTPPANFGSTIEPNETLPNTDSASIGLDAHYDVCPTLCADLRVLYRVYLTAANVTDTAFITVTYTCSTGITEYPAGSSLTDAYPNPATNSFSFNYALPILMKGELIIHDVTGKKIMELPIEKKEGTLVVPTNMLNPGVYFYTLLVGGQRSATKRLVISE